jgi:exosortase/archaeosortase family protein
MTLTAAYAYFFQPTWMRRGLLFLSSIPLAILGNVMRILTIVAVASWCDAETATGFYHDYSGFVVFLVAVGCMLGLSALVNRIFGEEVETEAPAVHQTGPKPVLVGAMGLLTIAVMVYQAFTPDPILTEAPQIEFREIAGFDSEELAPSESELQTLPADTIILKRTYRNARAAFTVSCVIGARSKGSLHRPELCLPSQGFQMVRPRTLKVGERSWRMMDLERGYGLPQGFAYTFFNQDGYGTSSHTGRILRDTLDRSLKNRYDRWVMVTVGGSTANPEAMREFLSRLEEVIWKN